jgi:hypothetical protein
MVVAADVVVVAPVVVGALVVLVVDVSSVLEEGTGAEEGVVVPGTAPLHAAPVSANTTPRSAIDLAIGPR